MKNWIRKFFFRLIPPVLIQREIEEYYRRLYSSRIVMGSGVTLGSSSRIFNLRDEPDSIKIGDQTMVLGELNTFKYGGKISLGARCFVGEGSRIWSGEEVVIGDDVLISHNVSIVDTNAHEMDFQERKERHISFLLNGHHSTKASIQTKPIFIHNSAWINFGAIILKGVTIGRGAIIAAGAVVTKDVEPFTVVAGNPARVVKILSEQA